jgi:RNA polymerase sigma factor (TIGR02999 family)
MIRTVSQAQSECYPPQVRRGTGGVVRIIELPMNDVTRILSAAERGDPAAAAELLPLVYQELRKLAAAKLTQERPGQTLDATGLVHEAYLRLVGPRADKTWQNSRHFFAAAAEAMRRILIDNARRKKRLKRGGDLRRVDQDEMAASNSEPPDRLLAINDAISQLALADPEAVEVVKLRIFVGFSIAEVADALGISRATAYRHWTYAKAWLKLALQEEDESQNLDE